MYEDKKNTSVLLVLFTSIIYVFIAIFVIFLIGLSRVNAASYYFDYPRINTICNNNRLGICTEASGNGISSSDSKYVGSPNGNAVGNYVNVIYRYDQNINNVSGTSYIAGNYSVSLKYQIYTVEGTEIDKNKIKVRLIYYPDNSNQYAYATCDNNENITITNAFDDSDMFNITYTCETLQITEGKSFLGFNIKIENSDDPFGLVDYIKFGQVITNMTLIGEGEATNNDIINNQNQNTQQIIDSVTNPDISGSNDTIGGFFGSFSDTDHGGLSGIITAPLIAFNQMLTGTCTDLSVEYKGSTTTLPCGTSFWNQISPIRDFLNITLGGLICYQIVRKLFLLIQKIKNPDDDRVEVMSL